MERLKLMDTDWLLGRHKRIDQAVSLQLSTIRGLSAIVVLVAHAYQIFVAPVYPTLYALFGLIAQFSVMVFFVLSGFLICKSITRNVGDNGFFSAGEYAADRADRILPPLLFSILIIGALASATAFCFPSGADDFLRFGGLMAREGFYVDPIDVLGSLVFINGFITDNVSANAPLWSLSFEVWYYFAIAMMLKLKGKKGVTAGAIMLCSMALLNKSFLLYSIVWFGGACVALMHNHGVHKAKEFTIAAVVSGVIAAIIGVFYLQSFAAASPAAQASTKLIPLWNLFSGLAFAAVLTLMLDNKISTPVVATWTSNFSYTLYIIHFPILLFIYGATQIRTMSSLPWSILAGVGALCICMVISYYSAKVVESLRPFKNAMTSRLMPGTE